MATQQYDIFISYRRTGGAQYARILQLMLTQRGYKVFLDYDELTTLALDSHPGAGGMTLVPYFDGERTSVTPETVEQCTQRKSLMYDRNGEEHYNIISALHKSMRNSDPDAAVYWLARMLEAGEDPLYVARRVTRFASEDVGLADPRALQIAVAAYQACHYIGMPEFTVHLTEAVVYLSLAPKSNAMETAYLAAKQDALKQLSEPVPLNIRNGVTQLMRNEGYGKGYQYAHDTAEKLTDMQCLPDSLEGREYYVPTDQGVEAKFGERLKQIKAWKAARRVNHDLT